jgi:hypothetical protein
MTSGQIHVRRTYWEKLPNINWVPSRSHLYQARWQNLWMNYYLSPQNQLLKHFFLFSHRCGWNFDYIFLEFSQSIQFKNEIIFFLKIKCWHMTICWLASEFVREKFYFKNAKLFDCQKHWFKLYLRFVMRDLI